ncbi:MAG TPA: hypothetical protein VFO24_05100, partial [Usitatibacter sp.]|nr:hypothetical protein [Usitatibacter sp.]
MRALRPIMTGSPKFGRAMRFGLVSRTAAAVLAVLGCFWSLAPAEAHWADQAAAEITVNGGEAHVSLTVPTSLVTSVRGRHLTDDELRRFLAAHLRLTGR